MADKERLAEVIKAGDKMAEMLGYTVAALEAGREFTPKQFRAARRGIVIWHRLKAIRE